jgi:hypothetical protein
MPTIQKRTVSFSDKLQKEWLKWAAIAFSILWVVINVYAEFIDEDPTENGFKSREVESRMQNCGGNFHQRYECKESLVLAKQRASFILWSERLTITFGPPIGISLLFRMANKRRRLRRMAMSRTKPKAPVVRPGANSPQTVVRRRVK